MSNSSDSSSAPVEYELVSHIPSGRARETVSKWRWLYDIVEGLQPGQILRFRFSDLAEAKRAKMALMNYNHREGNRLPDGFHLRAAQRTIGPSSVNVYVTLEPANQ